ncbi:sulfur carrier protein ThiS [Mariniflexile sp. HNIBRBA6329]|uniref:sulfur carrier protein ThiS n=1 Tax=Mariniflexile sp. HNIBRBA6329 TaxID=3373088 RepID=UPI003745BC04
MATIYLNESPINIEENINISQLLHQVNLPKTGIAVAVNTTIISQNNWETVQLKQNDHILIIQATQGG